MESGRSGGLLGFNEAAAVVALEAGASAGAQRRAFWERRRRQQGNEAVGWVPRELGVGSSALGYLPTGTARAAATALGLEWFTADHQRAPPASNLALCIYYSCGPPARPTRSRRNDRALSGSCVASPLLSSPPLWRSVLTRASSLLVRLPWRAPCSLGQGCAWVGVGRRGRGGGGLKARHPCLSFAAALWLAVPLLAPELPLPVEVRSFPTTADATPGHDPTMSACGTVSTDRGFASEHRPGAGCCRRTEARSVRCYSNQCQWESCRVVNKPPEATEYRALVPLARLAARPSQTGQQQHHQS